MNEYEMIEKILEPYSFADGKIYFYDELGRRIECDNLRVEVWRESLQIRIYTYFSYLHPSHFAKLGCDKVDPMLFSEDIRGAMYRKFGVWNIVCSDIGCDEYNKSCVFCLKCDTDQNIKYRKECEKKAIEFDEEIQKNQKRLVEKQRELDPISKQYKSLVRSRNSLPFYALIQKKEYDNKIITIKPEVDSLEGEIALLQCRIAGLINKRNDASFKAFYYDEPRVHSLND